MLQASLTLVNFMPSPPAPTPRRQFIGKLIYFKQIWEELGESGWRFFQMKLMSPGISCEQLYRQRVLLSSHHQGSPFMGSKSVGKTPQQLGMLY